MGDAVQLALLREVEERVAGLKPGVRSLRTFQEQREMWNVVRLRNGELREEVVVLEEALQSILDQKPLRSAVSGKFQCRTFPHCDHPGCQSFKGLQDIARTALEAVQALRSALRVTTKVRRTRTQRRRRAS